MKRTINNKLDMLKRITRFLLDHPITPAIARLTAATAEVNTVITDLDSGAEQQLSGKNQSMDGVDLRKSTARDLRVYLKDVCRTGRTLQDVNPGTRASFVMVRSGSYPALLTRARSIIAVATPIATSFHDAGMPTTFIADLTALLTAFETATGQKFSGRFSQISGTAVQKAKVSLGLMAANKIDAIVRNHYRANPEILAAWTSARHIRAAAKPKTDEQTSGTPPALTAAAAAASTALREPSTTGAPNATSIPVAIG